MTLSTRIAADKGPDRGVELAIAKAIGANGEWDCKPFAFHSEFTKPYLRSIDAAISIVQPAMQEHVMREALTLMGQRGFTVGKFTEQLARTICEVAMKERGL